MLRPVMVVCIVIRAIDAFRTFDIVWTISGGGPARATEVFSIYAYVEAFQFLNLARGSAAAVIGAIIIVVFAMAALSHAQPLRGGVEVSGFERIARAPARTGFFAALAPGGKARVLRARGVAVCLLFAFPVFWLVLTSLRPGLRGVYYVHRGTEFTIDNFHEVLSQEIVLRALFNSFMISTLATVLSLGVTATSGYMLSRFKGPIPNIWFSLDLHFSLRALCGLGAAALFRDAAAAHFRHLLGPAAAARRRPHLLLLLDHERLLRRDRPVHGIRRHDRRLLALGRILARCAAGGGSRPHRARDPVLALYLERVPVRAHPHRARDADPDRGHGAVRARARHGMASHERDRGASRSCRR